MYPDELAIVRAAFPALLCFRLVTIATQKNLVENSIIPTETFVGMILFDNLFSSVV